MNKQTNALGVAQWTANDLARDNDCNTSDFVYALACAVDALSTGDAVSITRHVLQQWGQRRNIPAQTLPLI